MGLNKQMLEGPGSFLAVYQGENNRMLLTKSAREQVSEIQAPEIQPAAVQLASMILGVKMQMAYPDTTVKVSVELNMPRLFHVMPPPTRTLNSSV